MNIAAGGRAALIVAAGLWIGVAAVALTVSDSARAAPSPGAAASEKQATAKKQTAQKPSKHRAATKPAHKIAAIKPKAADDAPGAHSAIPKASLASAADSDPALPDAVANANARMPSSALAADATAEQAAPSDHAAESQLVASDQLNDVDLAAGADAAPQPTVGRSVAVAALPPHDDSLWSQTSLIGKIFIAFGGLLTVASAARMFIV